MPDGTVAGAATLVLTTIDRIRRHLRDLDLEAFLASELHQDAVAMNLLVIGEALNRMPVELRTSVTDIPWQDVIGLRHRIAHGYDTLEFPLLWSIVEHDLEPLERAVRRLSDL